MLEVLSLPTEADHQVWVATSGKESGNMSTTYAVGHEDEVYRNREIFYRQLGLGVGQVVRIWADGLNKVWDLSTQPEPPLTETRGLRCDGLLTTEPHQGLAMVPADCVPMVVYGRQQPLLGLIHVGRENAEAGLHTIALEQIEATHGVAADDLNVYLGPCIQQASYRYEYLTPALAANEKWRPYIKSRLLSGFFLNLPGLIYDDLLAAGLPAEQISRSPVDTGSDPTYFSHRRSELDGEPEGRNGIVVCLR